jgi:hypothetical protein
MKTEYNGYAYQYKTGTETFTWIQAASSKTEADKAITEAIDKNGYKLIKYVGIRW